jgi:hypothetical protein
MITSVAVTLPTVASVGCHLLGRLARAHGARVTAALTWLAERYVDSLPMIRGDAAFALVRARPDLSAEDRALPRRRHC